MAFVRKFEDSFATLSYGKIHYIKSNSDSKEPIKILFLHGLGGTVEVWTRLFARMPSSFELWAIDLPGHGKSDAPHIDYSVENNTEILREFIVSTGLEGFSLFGHSYGGWLSMIYAMRFDVKSLILESPAGMKEEHDSAIEDGTAQARRDIILKAAEEINMNKNYVIESYFDSDNSENWLEADKLSGIKVRTMILWGSKDTLLEPQFAKSLNKMINGSELHMIEGAGHVAHYTNADEIAGYVTAFCEKA